MESSRYAPKKPPRPVMIFDGDCPFCQRWIDIWRSVTGDKIVYVPYQEKASEFPQVSIEDCRKAVQLLMPDGEMFEAAEAVFRSLAVSGRQSGWLWCYRHCPGFRQGSEALYRFVAGHRPFFSRLTNRFFGAQ